MTEINLEGAVLVYMVDEETFKAYRDSVPEGEQYTHLGLERRGISNIKGGLGLNSFIALEPNR